LVFQLAQVFHQPYSFRERKLSFFLDKKNNIMYNDDIIEYVVMI